jgi:hypothetical protein
MVSVLCRWSTRLVEQDKWAHDIMRKTWLTDGPARIHTDIVYMAVNEEPEMWLYAPFQSRPLGKPLPSLLKVCTCPGIARKPDGTPVAQQPRKVWKVTHSGKAPNALRDVSVKASCTVCKQSWSLPSENLSGRLDNAGGKYCAIVPYFAGVNIMTE